MTKFTRTRAILALALLAGAVSLRADEGEGEGGPHQGAGTDCGTLKDYVATESDEPEFGHSGPSGSGTSFIGWTFLNNAPNRKGPGETTRNAGLASDFSVHATCTQ